MFFTILSLCTAMACNDYYVDKALTQDDCMTNLVEHSDKMADVWLNEKDLQLFMTANRIYQDMALVSNYDYVCEFVPDNLIP